MFIIKEWYLITPNTRPNITGGFENDAFLDYKDDAFAESLDTDIAKTVILHNYDLSESTEIRCIVQGNSADTQLKSMERIGLFVRGTVKAGMYIFYENRYWLITGYPSYNGIYEKAVMQLCQYKLRWQNAKGEIIERYIALSSASKYDIGETGNSTIVLTSDNLTLLFPNDEESLNVYGKRVFIDKRTIPEKVYKITRSDDVLYDYGEEHGGILSFIADKTELNTTTDRQDLRICDYIEVSDDTEEPSTPTAPPENPNETTDLRASITFKGSQELKIGGTTKTLTGNFVDLDGNVITDVGVWEVITIDELLPYLEYTITDNTLKINVLDTDLIDSKVRIMFSSADGTVSTYLDFDVVSMF